MPLAYPKALYTLGDHLRKKRLDLKLQQKEVAAIIGVDEVSVYNWEHNRSSPSLRNIPGIIKFLGSIPSTVQPESFGEKIINARRLHGISQENLAHYLNVDPTL